MSPLHHVAPLNLQAQAFGECSVSDPHPRLKPTLEPCEDIALTLKVLSDHLAAQGVEKGLVHLGGGSVLAAAWKHRQSTDIDLWISYEESGRLSRMAKNNKEWTRLTCPNGSEIVTKNTRWAEGSMQIKLNNVDVSLFTTHFARRNQKNRQIMRGTIFGAATTEEILSGKIAGRWTASSHEPIPIRDIYDVYVARTVEPTALTNVINRLNSEQRKSAHAQLRALPESWHKLDKKPLVKPQFSVELQGAARRLADAIEAREPLGIEICERIPLRGAQSKERGR